MRRIGKLVRCTAGATAIEYGLIVALVVIVTIGGISAVGSSTQGKWGDVAAKVASVEP